MKKDLVKIIKHWGVRKQLKHFNSEVFELNEAILDYDYAQKIFGKNSILNAYYLPME